MMKQEQLQELAELAKWFQYECFQKNADPESIRQRYLVRLDELRAKWVQAEVDRITEERRAKETA